MKRERMVLVMTAVLCLGVGLANAGLVNPSFEEPAIPEGQTSLAAVPTNWTMERIGGASYYVVNDFVYEGSQSVSFPTYVWEYQVSDIVMQEGVTYKATVMASSDREVAGDDSFLALIADNVSTVLASTSGHAGTYNWIQLTAEYTCTAENAGKNIGVRLGAHNSSIPWQWQNYDALTLTPEPATMGLLAVGGLGVLLRRRR